MRVEHLTVTRFVAATAVVLFHIAINSRHVSSSRHLLVIGDSAVSYFFVLSGFILVVSRVRDGQLPRRVSAVPFWRNRFARIYPLYVVAFLAAVVLGVVMGLNTIGDLQVGPTVASVLLLQSWVPPFATYINYPGWSLSVETLFYLLFPLLFPVLVGQRTRTIVGVVGLVWLISLGVHMKMLDAGASHNLVLYLPLLHLNTFLVGMVTGIILIRHQTWLAHHTGRVTLAFMLSLPVFAWLIAIPNPIIQYYHNGLFAPFFALFIGWLSIQKNGVSRQLSRPFPVWLGEISYGIYLLQVPVGMVFFGLYGTVFQWSAPLYILAYLITLCGVAALFYHTIEQPARRSIRQWTTRTTTVPAPAADERFHHLT